MTCFRRILFSVLVTATALANASFADVPKKINYQGKLTDSSGDPLDTTVSMTFTIYDDSTGGAAKWTELHPSVAVEKGLFSVILGTTVLIEDTVFGAPDRFLGVQVGTDPELTPRSRFVSIGYAHRVSTVDGATGGSIYGEVSIGYSNTNSGYAGFVAGADNTVSEDNSVVSGGRFNVASAEFATVGGGTENSADSTWATVGGGYSNTASKVSTTVAGGNNNTAGGGAATVSGGADNTANGTLSSVGGGRYNTAGDGGYANTVCGGAYNSVDGSYSVIPGGKGDTLTSTADVSMAFGEGVYVNQPRRVVFFDSLMSGRLGINRDDQDGGIDYPIHVGSNTLNGNGAYLSIGGMWTNGSSRGFKDRFVPLDGQQVLRKLSAIPIEAWNYKGSPERHIGPVAEDFVSAFDVGTIRPNDGQRENRYLAAGDIAGVALLCVQQLARENNELRRRIEDLELLVEGLTANMESSAAGSKQTAQNNP